MTPSAGPRILMYSHDTYGLGHLRRSLMIAERLADASPNASVLIVTGSSRARSFALAGGCDTLKLPSVIKQSDGGYTSRTLRIPVEDLCRMRSGMIAAAAAAFQPDLVLVDHAPAGVLGELRPLLESFSRTDARPRLVLGLRDVVDEASKVREEWDRLGVFELLDGAYDDVLVYGDPRLPTTAEELGLARLHPEKVRHVGYVAREPSPSMARAAVGRRPYVLVTTGGGGDGRDLVAAYAAYLESLAAPAPFRSVVVMGPFLSESRSRELRARLLGTGSEVDVIGFTDDLESLTAEAAAVIGMAGYNTATEVLGARVPALFIPRAAPRAEQTIRCQRLARLSGISWCPAAEATPDRIGMFLASALRSGRLPEPRVDLGGLGRVTAILCELLGGRQRAGAARDTRTAG